MIGHFGLKRRSRTAASSIVLSAVVLASATGCLSSAAPSGDGAKREAQSPAVTTVETPAARSVLPRGPRIVFRHTGLDDDYGMVAAVRLRDPGGPRTFTEVACDRVYATADTASCLRTQRGVVTQHELVELDPRWRSMATVPLPGIPSRTRLSPDGLLVADTTFITGHTYMQVGFSTATEIREVGGYSYGNLEKFTLVLDGRRVTPRDRNVWGVTFAPDDDTFYATVGTGGRTYLVRGSLHHRTLTSIAAHVECPSLSPDGRRIGFKQATRRDGVTWWTPAVLDLASGDRTVLSGERRNIDDQVEWLDDDTLLYGVPRTDEPGVTDVWSLDTRSDARPHRFIEDAWSPAVVR